MQENHGQVILDPFSFHWCAAHEHNAYTLKHHPIHECQQCAIRLISNAPEIRDINKFYDFNNKSIMMFLTFAGQSFNVLSFCVLLA